MKWFVALIAGTLFATGCQTPPGNPSGNNSQTLERSGNNAQTQAPSSSAQSPGGAQQQPSTGVTGVSAPSQMTWARYDDPSERAFSLEVPQGWEATGGLYRFGYVDVRWMMDVRSPDGTIILRVNDVNVPAYALPSPHTPPEGQPFIKPRQFQMVVAGYRQAQLFADIYSKYRFKSVCQNAASAPLSWKPTLPATYRDVQPMSQSEASVSFTCDTTAGPHTALVYARTSIYGVYGGGYWTADPLISVLATPDKVDLAESVAQHMLDTITRNPEWEQFQKRMTQAGAVQMEQQYQQFLVQMRAYHEARTNAWNQQVAGYEARQAAQAHQVARWGDTLTGLTECVDPQTGTHFKVWTGPYNNYYRNGAGTTVNANTPPSGEYHPMQPVH